MREIKPGEELTDNYDGFHALKSESFFSVYGFSNGPSSEHWSTGDCETIRAAQLEQSESQLLRNAHELAGHHCAWNAEAAPLVSRNKTAMSKLSCVPVLVSP